MLKKLMPPLLWILIFQLIGGAIGFYTNSNMDWYDTLEKSALTPPGYVFGIVWPCLYVMLALAGWRMWTQCRDQSAFLPFRLYWLQMILNWGWSFVFFKFHQIELGFIWIVVFDLAMLGFIVSAWKNYRIAALLVVPTLLWGCFAAYLNFAIWVLN